MDHLSENRDDLIRILIHQMIIYVTTNENMWRTIGNSLDKIELSTEMRKSKTLIKIPLNDIGFNITPYHGDDNTFPIRRITLVCNQNCTDISKIIIMLANLSELTADCKNNPISDKVLTVIKKIIAEAII